MFVDDVPGSALIPKKNKFDALIYIFCFIPFFMQPELMAYYGEHFAKMIHTILHALNVYKYFNLYKFYQDFQKGRQCLLTSEFR